MEISDIDSLQKQNITIESSSKEYTQIIEKAILLKNNIENEINEINKLYEKTINDITKFFQEKHEELLKEENDMKEELQIKVTKTKEKLENFWSETNSQIKLSERIQQGIKKMENEEKKNMIKNLSYVSKINKNQKKMINLFKELMKSLKFVYNKEENKIKYDEFCFNGLPIPKNIEFKEISYTSISISWKIDNINIINIESNNIKYKVEIRKEGENEIFKEVFEGNNKCCIIDKLEINTNYEFRICSFYNEFRGYWTEIKTFKTLELDSNIIKESKREKEFIPKILEWCGYKKMELIYRGTRDGTTNKAFHSKCDNKGPTISLFKNEKGYIFGGFADISWKSEGGWQSAPNSFIFTLTNIHNIEPTKFPRKSGKYGIYHDSSNGIWFGGGPNIGFYSDFMNNNAKCYFPEYDSYNDILGKGKSIFTSDLNNNNLNYKISEIEVFKLYK